VLRNLIAENTNQLVKAIDLCVPAMELHVMITKYQVVMSHESFFNHTITTAKEVPLVKGVEEFYLITFLNNFSLPLNGGYFIAGSNQVGVFIIAFL
jgi:hypothetical protein